MTTNRELLVEALEDAVEALTAALDEARICVNGHDAHEVLGHVTNGLADVVEAQDSAVALWRSYGATWTEVGEFYGVTRQAATQRFGERVEA